MKNLPNWSLLFVGALFAACAALPERPQRSDYEIDAPQSWQQRDSDQTEAEPLQEWWTRIGSTGLNRVIENALQHNLDLRSAAARLQAAALQARIAGADLYPNLNLSLDARRQRQVFVGLPIPGPRPLSQTFNNFGISLNTSWELDLWGRIRAGHNAADADFRAAQQDWRGLHQSLTGQVCKVFFAVTEAREQVALAQQNVGSFELTERQVRGRFESGVRPALDLRRAQSNRANAQANLRLREEQLARATRQLDLLQGRYPSGKSMAEATLPKASFAVPVGQPASLLRRRPDIIAAEQRLRASGFRVDEARAALYPRISLTAAAGTTSDAFEDLLDSDFFVWNVAGNLLQPIFQGGRLRDAVRLATAREREALAQYANATLRAYGEVESALVARGYLDQRFVSLQEASDAAVAAKVLSEERYRKGLVDFLVVSEAQRNALSLQSQLLALRRLRLDLYIDLQLALGGGFAPPQEQSIDGPQPGSQP